MVFLLHKLQISQLHKPKHQKQKNRVNFQWIQVPSTKNLSTILNITLKGPTQPALLVCCSSLSESCQEYPKSATLAL